MDEAAAFNDCSAEYVFGEVGKRLASPETRALWMRLLDEMKRQGIGASISYMEGEFTRLREEFTHEVSRLAE